MTMTIKEGNWYNDEELDTYFEEHGISTDSDEFDTWRNCLSDEIQDDYLTFVEIANELMREFEMPLRFMECKNFDDDVLQWKCYEVLVK